jgi:hypothetical protein
MHSTGCARLGLVHLQVEQRIERGQVDRDRYPMIVDLGQHPMLVRAPLGETRQIVDDARGIGMKDVRPVAVDHDARRIQMVVGVAADVITAVDHQHVQAQACGQALGNDAAGKAGTHHQVIIGASIAVRGRATAGAVEGYLRHSICSFMALQVLSHDMPSNAASAWATSLSRASAPSAYSTAAMNAAGVSAMVTTPLVP